MIMVLVLFVVLLIAGAPIVFTMGVSASLVLMGEGIPSSIISQRLFAGLDSFTIMAIPFFVLSGLLMERGGIARRMIDFATALVGWIRGSLLLVSVVSGTGLAAVSGSGSADTAATASLMLPEMRRRRYDIDFAAGLMAAAGSLGPVIPPSIMMIVLASVGNVSVGDMFIAGVVPGFLMAAGLLLAGYLHARRHGGVYSHVQPFSLRELGSTAFKAIPAFLMPLIIIGGIVGGVFTPTEAAAVAVATGLLVGLLIYRELKLRDLPRLILRAASISASVMMIIAVANIFSWLVAREGAPQLLVGFLQSISDNPLIFLALLNVGLLFIGMFMESIAAILILVPVLMPVAQSYGIDPLHLGVVIIINLSIGMVTPPYGITLFVASSIAQRPIMRVASKIVLPLSFMLAVLLLATYVPQVVTALPDLFRTR
ncbi:TRAP transporter large permease [Vreelandella malpeensis]|uniref:TRAP transporter large permease protein n=1 Tax=Vreelandella malpeensis TaxID=1172368 RepID=A0ABS8DPS5_9GAMM|nr:TRAP transporter large permease [Halomonas malpeensis]MCB8888292.1 TRAP transporter large permease [Halomonas malpeensis]